MDVSVILTSWCVVLGLVLLFTFYTMGRGLGSSSTFARIGTAAVAGVVPEHAKSNQYFSGYLSEGTSPLLAWLVFLTGGAGLGGLFSAFCYPGRRRMLVCVHSETTFFVGVGFTCPPSASPPACAHGCLLLVGWR